MPAPGPRVAGTPRLDTPSILGPMLERLLKGIFGSKHDRDVQRVSPLVDEINGLADLKGLKLRSAGLGGELFQRLGAVTVSLGVPDIYPALQSGTIDIGLLRLSRGEDHALRTAMVWREPLVVVLVVDPRI